MELMRAKSAFYHERSHLTPFIGDWLIWKRIEYPHNLLKPLSCPKSAKRNPCMSRIRLSLSRSNKAKMRNTKNMRMTHLMMKCRPLQGLIKDSKLSRDLLTIINSQLLKTKIASHKSKKV